MDQAQAIADAVLYEGYILWPYRRSALKNTRRWTFGGVHPPAWSARHPDDRCEIVTECLLESGDGAAVDVRVRFLQVVARQAHRDEDGRLVPADELEVGSQRFLSWDEATEREVAAEALRLGDLAGAPARIAIDVPAGRQADDIRDRRGVRAGVLSRSWLQLRGHADVQARRLEPDLFRLSVRVANATAYQGEDREAALRHTLCSTHTVLRARDGAFVSLTDPPQRLREAASRCRNEGAWPVLLGEPGERTAMLASPIILEDHPRVAPESPGDLFDGGEIDQLLTLNILALTDEEKRAMRDCDPRAREILERTEALTPEQLMRLHGAVRELRVVRR